MTSVPQDFDEPLVVEDFDATTDQGDGDGDEGDAPFTMETSPGEIWTYDPTDGHHHYDD